MNQQSLLRVGQVNILNSPQDLSARYRRLAVHSQVTGLEVMTLQEVANPTLLEEALRPAGYQHFAWAATKRMPGSPQADCVGIASRCPLGDTTEISLGGSERPALRAEIESPEGVIHLISAHFAWGSNAEGVRLNQAALINNEALLVCEKTEAPIILGCDLNSDEDSRTARYLRGLDLDAAGDSTHWTDAYCVAGVKEDWATSDQGVGELGRATAARRGVVLPELIPARRIDFLFSYGWNYGKVGTPITFGRFGTPLIKGEPELSDHFGVWADFLIAP